MGIENYYAFVIEDASTRAQIYREKRQQLEQVDPPTEAIAEQLGRLSVGEEHWTHRAEVAGRLLNVILESEGDRQLIDSM